jgi:hypothetical protein
MMGHWMTMTCNDTILGCPAPQHVLLGLPPAVAKQLASGLIMRLVRLHPQALAKIHERGYAHGSIKASSVVCNSKKVCRDKGMWVAVWVMLTLTQFASITVPG